MLLDQQFPRSVRYCIQNSERSLHAITGNHTPAQEPTLAAVELGKLRAEFEFLDVGDVLASGLHTRLADLQEKLGAAGNAVHHTFFANRPIENRP